MSEVTQRPSEVMQLLKKNKAWAQEMRQHEASFFEQLAQTQTPHFLWIGCSDSRVPANTITGTRPGEIFVHRNIANVVVHTDLNVMSVLTYAVNVLKVQDVIVCGHSGCGGIRAAMSHIDFGLLNKWLCNIKDVYAANRAELSKIENVEAREGRLCELNAIAQMKNLAKTAVVQNAWRTRRGPYLHAWAYSLKDGILNELATIAPGTKLDDPYTFDLS